MGKGERVGTKETGKANESGRMATEIETEDCSDDIVDTYCGVSIDV